MATTRQRTSKAKVKDPAPVEAPPDQPIPARPAPRPKDAPLTIKELRLAREGKKPARAKAATNVLREGLRLERVPDPSVLVLFGATGDLAHRKVIPALYQLWRTNLLPHEFMLLAIGRRPYDDEAFRAEIRKSLEGFSRVLPLDEDAWRSFAERITYERLRLRRPEGLRLPGHAARRHRQGTRDARQPPLLPRHPALAVRRSRRPARARRARPRAPRRRLAAGRHREAVRA